MENGSLTMVELGVSDDALRMIKTFSMLSGKGSKEVSEEIGAMVSDILVDKLKARIASQLGIEQAVPARQPHPTAVATRVASFQDTTGIADGLGDVEPVDPEQIEGTTDELAAVPQSGGLTEKALDEDMDVANPAVEAKGEPPVTWADQMAQGAAADGMFAEAAGFVDARIAKRKKRPGGKGRAVALTHNHNESTDAQL